MRIYDDEKQLLNDAKRELFGGADVPHHVAVRTLCQRVLNDGGE